MEASVVVGVESSVESDPPGPTLEVRLLGAMAIRRAGSALALPASRKMRALVAYLALSPRAAGRSHLCELLWDVPNDPRGELRWCPSKIRGLLDEPGRRRVDATGDTVALDLADCFVDVVEIARAAHQGIEALALARLHALSALFTGDFLEGLEIDRSPQFGSWLLAQRRRFRAIQASVLEQIVARLPPDSEELQRPLERWLALFPFDRRPHELLLDMLARRARIGEGDEHVEATARRFDAEGLDMRPIRNAWRDARARHGGPMLAAPVSAPAASTLSAGALETPVLSPPRRASIVVMPFAEQAHRSVARGGLADGLAHDIITRLAKLRSLFVIAQGTAFALDEKRVGAEEAGRTLNVDYAVGGSLRRQGKRIVVNVELTETRTARIVWAEIFDRDSDDTFAVLDEIGNRIVASVVSEIETLERNRAILKPPSSLDAWEALHRGLWHMYRFNRGDNEQARHFFEMAVRLDPTFARAWAGLSFTHFQSAFQHWGTGEREIAQAFETAERGLAVDDRDPAAHWAMGRALWLRGNRDESLGELATCVDISPNFALGHYTLAFVHCQSGDPLTAIGYSDHSRHLSLYDLLLFAMLATRAIALARLGRYDEAADWATKAAARPNAHVHIRMIAAHCLALADRLDDARALVGRIRETSPRYRAGDFFDAFRFSADAERLLRTGTARLGLE